MGFFSDLLGGGQRRTHDSGAYKALAAEAGASSPKKSYTKEEIADLEKQGFRVTASGQVIKAPVRKEGQTKRDLPKVSEVEQLAADQGCYDKPWWKSGKELGPLERSREPVRETRSSSFSCGPSEEEKVQQRLDRQNKLNNAAALAAINLNRFNL